MLWMRHDSGGDGGGHAYTDYRPRPLQYHMKKNQITAQSNAAAYKQCDVGIIAAEKGKEMRVNSSSRDE